MTPDDLDPLSRLAIHHGSDKFGGHLHTPVYHRLFGHLRDRPVRLLEIGIGGYDVPEAGGASLHMWAAYFPAGRIVGLDIAPKMLDMPANVVMVHGSQADEALLRRLSEDHGPFDIVIDDGSHQVPHVLGSFRCLYPLLAPDGMYVVEDTQTAFHPDAGGNPSGRSTIYDLADRLTRDMHRPEGFVPPDGTGDFGAITASVAFHRNMIVFTRGENTYPSNHGLNLDHPEVRAVWQAMEQEAARNPGPRDSLTRIDMCIWGRRPDQAARLALAAARQWPGDAELLSELIRMMAWAGQGAARAALEGRLGALRASQT